MMDESLHIAIGNKFQAISGQATRTAGVLDREITWPKITM